MRTDTMESSLIKSLSEKLINSVLFGIGRRPTWYAIIVQISGVARSRYLAFHSARSSSNID